MSRPKKRSAKVRARAERLDDGPSVPSMAEIEAAFDLAEAAAEQPAAPQPTRSEVTLEEALITVEGILAHAERRPEPSGAPVEPESHELSAEDLDWLLKLLAAGGHQGFPTPKEQ